MDARPTQDWGPPQRRDQQDTKETTGREHHFTHSNPHCQRYPFQYLFALYVLRWGPPRDYLSGRALFGNGTTPARRGPPQRHDNDGPRPRTPNHALLGRSPWATGLRPKRAHSPNHALFGRSPRAKDCDLKERIRRTTLFWVAIRGQQDCDLKERTRQTTLFWVAVRGQQDCDLKERTRQTTLSWVAVRGQRDCGH